MQKYYIVSKQGWAVIGREVLRGSASTRQRVIMSITYGKFGCRYMCEMARTRARYNHDDDVVDVDDEGKSINKQNQFKRDLSELSFHIPARPRGPVVTVPSTAIRAVRY